MSVYLDASVIVALFIEDSNSARAQAAMAGLSDEIVVSDIAALEVASALARRARAGHISAKVAREALSDFDAWSKRAGRLQIEAGDISAADAIVRRFDINLHGADAIHVAVARRADATLLTLDTKMKASAKKAGLAVI